MLIREVLSSRPRLAAAIASVPLLCVTSCTTAETFGTLAAGAGIVAAATGDSKTRRIAGAIAVSAAAIALYSSYKANQSQVQYATTNTGRRATKQYNAGTYSSTGNNRIVAVSVPADPNATKSVKNKDLASKPKKTVMLWDNEKGKLADSKAYEIDATQAKSGEEINLGGKKVLYTGL